MTWYAIQQVALISEIPHSKPEEDLLIGPPIVVLLVLSLLEE